MKIHFRKLPQVDVVVFDESNAEVLFSVIDSRFSTFLLKTRELDIWVNPSVLLNIFWSLNEFSYSQAKCHKKGFFIGALKECLIIYLKACLLTINPRGVITYTDNCEKFSRLSSTSKQFKFIAVQNGTRLQFQMSKSKIYSPPHLFCFGFHEKHILPRYGAINTKFYPSGSLLMNFFKTTHSESRKKRFDVLIVSCWRGNINLGQEVHDTMEAMRSADNEIAHYVNTRKLRVGVILRAERDSEHWVMPEIGMSEEEYFLSIYGSKIEIIDNNFKKRPIVELIFKSELILSGGPTSALLEAFGFGKKILYCDYSHDKKYFLDMKNPIKFKKNSKLSLSKTLDDLLKKSNESYIKEHKELMEYYMKVPKDESTIEFIKKTIISIIAH